MSDKFKAPILLKLRGATGMGLELSIIPINTEGVRAVINKLLFDL